MNVSVSEPREAVLSQPSQVPPDGWEQPVVAPFLLKATPVSPKAVAVIGSYLGGLDNPGRSAPNSSFRLTTSWHP
jgi:hypothetical protein